MSSTIYKVAKRLFDVVFSLICIIFLLPPITVIVKIIYLITKDYNSIFYSQERIGLNGKIFKIYKYRSMIIDADEKLAKEIKKHQVEWNDNHKINNDSRVTKAGKILRRYCIDELPQVINILKGEMSFVGNRPYLLIEKEEMKNYYKEIIKTKPGLTGLWQISDITKLPFKERLKLDSYYSNNRNVLLDIKIIIKTFKVVLLGRR